MPEKFLEGFKNSKNVKSELLDFLCELNANNSKNNKKVFNSNEN